jgi:peptidoglycan/LPS O-acetylase OafA/YrhL
MFVVLHHIWLTVYPGFPHNIGPPWLGWLLYGHLAVVVFIVVSGYSLTLAPSRHGFTLNGGWRTFARRRAWRILPCYWAALVLSMLVVSLLTAPRGGGHVTAKSFLVYGGLVQDALNAPSPNGAFWSIAVEAQIYVLFPLMLVIRRRRDPITTAALIIAAVVALEVVAQHVHAFARYNNLSPALYADFALGMAAAGYISVSRDRRRRPPYLAIAGLAAVLTMLVFNRMGSARVVANYFTVDIFVGAIAALAFLGMANSNRSRIRRFFGSRIMVFGGEFSYSIYLVHALILAVLFYYVIQPLHLGRLASMGLFVSIALPCVLAGSYLMFLGFEKRFLLNRSADALPAPIRRVFTLLTRPWHRGEGRTSAGSAPAVASAGDASP